jgi:hypothetical protein
MQMMDMMNINTGENENANRCWLQYEVSSPGATIYSDFERFTNVFKDLM